MRFVIFAPSLRSLLRCQDGGRVSKWSKQPDDLKRYNMKLWLLGIYSGTVGQVN